MTSREERLKIINELVDKIISQTLMSIDDQSYLDLQWIKFHAKELTVKCKECEDKNE